MKLKKIFVPSHPDLQDATVLDLRASVGQKIKYNHLIVRLVQANGIATPILSPYAGIIKQVTIKLGDKVSPGALILLIAVDTALAGEDEEELVQTLEDQGLLQSFDDFLEETEVDIFPEEEETEEKKPTSPHQKETKETKEIDTEKVIEKAWLTSTSGLFIQNPVTTSHANDMSKTKKKYFRFSAEDVAALKSQAEIQPQTPPSKLGEPLSAATEQSINIKKTDSQSPNKFSNTASAALFSPQTATTQTAAISAGKPLSATTHPSDATQKNPDKPSGNTQALFQSPASIPSKDTSPETSKTLLTHSPSTPPSSVK
jgi:hypothetical protein